MIKRKLYIQLVLCRRTSLTLQFPWRRHLQRDHNKVPWFAEFSFGLIKGYGFGGFRQIEDCRCQALGMVTI
ncbi:hypothetical protein RchiOBHm_Chr6g0272631 [Rosa chinensis]|uniref:Uncharacterized protein n=1 Tax=Rosa chinensis TaxID=74649 RepID=A0A2P6PR90_ROSCH|nr:hypothetical protein RchiOBHm_Chr6g0272631 [Rosa chinensis]